jgi:hypothetical protein
MPRYSSRRGNAIAYGARVTAELIVMGDAL